MKTKNTQSKYRCKKGCGCKLCKPQKGGHVDKRSLTEIKKCIDFDHQLKDLKQ